MLPRQSGAVGQVSDLWWPTALPSSDLDYSFDLVDLTAIGDTAAIAALVIAPSGTGELQALDLSVTGDTLIAQLSGGQPGRVYQIALTITGISGRVYEYVINLQISAATLIAPPAPPLAPDPGFGNPITWTSGATVFGPALAAVQAGLIGTGTNQATALVFIAQTNIIATVSPPAGFKLPLITSGTIVAQNDDAIDNAPIYPPEGARINDLAINAPFILGSFGARLSFSTQNAATQWYAG